MLFSQSFQVQYSLLLLVLIRLIVTCGRDIKTNLNLTPQHLPPPADTEASPTPPHP